jgi:hypothetical protein
MTYACYPNARYCLVCMDLTYGSVTTDGVTVTILCGECGSEITHPEYRV